MAEKLIVYTLNLKKHKNLKNNKIKYCVLVLRSITDVVSFGQTQIKSKNPNVNYNYIYYIQWYKHKYK